MIAGTQGVMGEVEAQLAAARRRITALEGQCRELHRGIASQKARTARQRRDAERFRTERNRIRNALREWIAALDDPEADDTRLVSLMYSLSALVGMLTGGDRG